ncbi:MAG: hypothetical protein H0X40_15250 [Chthoniobacterales bacterium]|nr:hypothetical protein [Chthoniobacterales bacterium]
MKRISHLALLLALIAPLLLVLGGCGEDAPDTTAKKDPHVHLNEIDFMINDYEKAATHFVKTVKKFKAGDVSLTMRYIDEGKGVQDWQAKLQQAGARMTPEETQRAAAISAKVTPDLPK